MNVKINKVKQGLFYKEPLTFPGDKSLSHRAIIFGSLAEGESHFTNVLTGEDCVCTRQAFEAMGVKIKSPSPTELIIDGVGLNGLKAPKKDLYLGNSGTSMRLLLGVLAGQSFEATVAGDPSLSSRPMRRVIEHLERMGACFEGRERANFAPIKVVKGGKLKGIETKLSVASAQVKSAILLAGLYADGITSVTEPIKSRDHTERFLEYFLEKPIGINGLTVSVRGGQKLRAKSFPIAGDISSAAFFMAMALLVKNSMLRFKNVLANPTRSGVLHVIERSCGIHLGSGGLRGGPEIVHDCDLQYHELKAFEIKKEELPSLIDEIPILCVIATQATGKSTIHEADELRVKETDRIESMVSQLSKMGANIRAEGNTLIIEGPSKLHGAEVESFKDHRTAMSLVVAGLLAEGETVVKDLDCINTSFPNFFQLLKKVGVDYELC